MFTTENGATFFEAEGPVIELTETDIRDAGDFAEAVAEAAASQRSIPCSNISIPPSQA